MNIKKLGGAAAGLLLAMASLPTHAQLLVTDRPGVYGHLGFGRAQLSSACQGQAQCDRSGLSGRLGAGLRITGGWAVEFGRHGLGNFDYKRSPTDSHRDIEVEAWQIGVAQHIELTPQWLLVPRVGLGRISAQTDVGYWPSSHSERRREWQPYAGLSLAWRLNRVLSLQLQADYQRVPLRHEGGVDDNAGALSLGLGLGFNY